MAKKIIWILVSCLMVLSLVMASCGPAEEEAEVEVGEEEVEVGEGEVEVGEEEVVEEEEGILPSDVPKYGGTITITWMKNYGFDPFKRMFVMCGHVYLVDTVLISGNWAKCAAGTGENDALASFGGRMEFMTGWLAESWDLPDEETIIFHIRKGVHYQDKPPASGREVTADDVVWNIEKAFSTPTTWQYMFTVAGNNPTSIKALDKYTVELKVKPRVRAMLLLEIGNQLRLEAPDGYKAGLDMDDWKNACGAGPWILVDWVPDVSARYERNPNYYMMDPMHPENRLPYADKLVTLYPPDASTTQAAFRTGKIDNLVNISWEDREMFRKQCPALEEIQTLPDFTPIIAGRVDKPELPFKDIRVRRALNMGINKQEIIDDYYDGHADMLAYPVKNMKPFAAYYIPLEQLSQSIQELFVYNPDKAKQLLAEAGYPDGFSTVVQTTSDSVDYLSMIKAYWAKIGVDLSIEVLERGALSSISNTKTHKEMLMSIAKTSLPFFFWTERYEDLHNKAMCEIPEARAAYEAMNQALGVSDAEVIRIMREAIPPILEYVPYVMVPLNHCYTMWWPWLQNYHGEQDIGYCAQASQWGFVWIGTALKKSMGY
jgi:peptide/nickel transport system substrate-binding protein